MPKKMDHHSNGKGTPDLEGLRKLYDTNQTAKLALDRFAKMQRSRRVTTLRSLSQALHVDYSEAKDFIERMAQLNCGDYIWGRKGKPSRMEWRVDVVSLGQAAAGQRADIEELTGPETDEPEEELEPQPTGTNYLSVAYPLQPNRTVQLILPKDLTTTEANRLAEFVKTLRFDEAGANVTT